MVIENKDPLFKNRNLLRIDCVLIMRGRDQVRVKGREVKGEQWAQLVVFLTKNAIMRD